MSNLKSPSVPTEGHDAAVVDLHPERLATTTVEETEIMRLTLCGSTRFRDEYELWNKRLTLAGFLVYSVSGFGHSGDVFTDEEKSRLDQIHLAKIDASHAIVVINPGGYIGASTAREIAHAEHSGKPVYYTAGAGRTVYQLRTGPDGFGSLRDRAFGWSPTTDSTAEQVGIGAADEPKTSPMIATTQQATGEGEPSDRAKLIAYQDAHDVARELGYPSLTEALEALAQQAVSPPEGVWNLPLHSESAAVIKALKNEARRIGKGVPEDYPGFHKTLWTAALIIEAAEEAYRHQMQWVFRAPDAIGEEKGSLADARTHRNAADGGSSNEGEAHPSSETAFCWVLGTVECLKCGGLHGHGPCEPPVPSQPYRGPGMMG